MPAKGHGQRLGAAVFRYLHADAPQLRHQLRQQIPPQGSRRFAAQGQLPPVKAALRPQEK